MEWVITLIVGFLTGSVAATLVQVRADWRRHRGDRVAEGSHAFLTEVDMARSALDALAESAGEVDATRRRVEEIFAEVEASGSALSTEPVLSELTAYLELLGDVHEARRWPGAERADVVRETAGRVMAELPAALADTNDPVVREQASKIGRALTQNSLASQQMQDVHLNAHKRIDAARRQRSRLAISLASIPTRDDVLEAADKVVTWLQNVREETDKAFFNDTDPRAEAAVRAARDVLGVEVDDFCLKIADAVEGPASRRWRWRF